MIPPFSGVIESALRESKPRSVTPPDRNFPDCRFGHERTTPLDNSPANLSVDDPRSFLADARRIAFRVSASGSPWSDHRHCSFTPTDCCGDGPHDVAMTRGIPPNSPHCVRPFDETNPNFAGYLPIGVWRCHVEQRTIVDVISRRHRHDLAIPVGC